MTSLSERFTQFNEYVATKTTVIMSTMWCVYAFTLWSMLPTVAPSTKDFIFYVSGGIIQLVALPLIMVGQNVLNRASEGRAAEDHAALMEEHATLLEEVQLLKDIKTDLDEIKAKLGA